MNKPLLAIAIISALCALIPSKKESEWWFPWASVGLAINAGICAVAALG